MKEVGLVTGHFELKQHGQDHRYQQSMICIFTKSTKNAFDFLEFSSSAPLGPAGQIVPVQLCRLAMNLDLPRHYPQ